MQKITSIHFPETIAQYEGFRQLLLFFDAITIFMPSEDSRQPEHFLVQAGLLSEHTPAPFGDHLKIFQRLVKDIQSNGSDFYGSYMSSLSAKAAIDVDENSVLELIKLMSPPNELKPSKGNQLDALMQARLLLRLNEIKQHEERETGEALAAFKLKKLELLAALKGDADDDELEQLFPDLDVTPEPENPVRIKQRLKAWTELLLADNNTGHWLATTGSAECFELLREMEKDPGFPTKLFEIALPELAQNQPDELEYLQVRMSFQEHTANDRQTLVNFLQKVSEDPAEMNKDNIAETITNWDKEVAKISSGPKKLEFHLFNKPLHELLKNACGIKHGEAQADRPNTIIGVIG